MSFDKTPTTWIPGYTYADANLHIPISAWTEITAAEANASSGDIRKMYFGMCEGMYNSYNDTLVDNRPTKMSLFKGSSYDSITGVNTVQYTFLFKTAILTQDVETE